MASKNTPLQSRAWLLQGATQSMPGLLNWDGEFISYIACGPGTFTESEIRTMVAQAGQPIEAASAIIDEQPTALMTFRSSEIQAFKMPWYYFKGGIQITVENRTYKFSFVRPQNTVEPTFFLEDQFRWVGGAGQEDVDISDGKATGLKWKRLLENITR